MNSEKIAPLTKEAGLKLAEEFKGGGLSRKNFCAQHQIKPHTLYYWLQKLKSELNGDSKAGFIALQLPIEQTRCQQIFKIKLKDELIIEVPANLPPSELINLLKACQACG